MRLPSSAAAGAGLLARAAWPFGAARARLPLAGALSLAFGLMLVTTLAAVLAVAIHAGAANTRALLTDRTNLLLDSLAGRVQGLLQPAAAQLEFLRAEIGEGDLDPVRALRGHGALRAVLALAPQVAGVAFVRAGDLKAFRFLREGGALPAEDWSGSQGVRALMDAARPGDPVRWGAPAWADDLRQTVINAHLPIHGDGRLLGLMFVAVAVDTVVRFVDELSAGIGQRVFVLQGQDEVVALPGLDTSFAGPGRPLPLLAEAGDPVLAAMWVGAEEPITFLGDRLRGEARAVEAGGREWVVLYREIAGFGDQPWIVGTYVPASVAGAEVERLWRALLLGAACLALASLAT